MEKVMLVNRPFRPSGISLTAFIFLLAFLYFPSTFAQDSNVEKIQPSTEIKEIKIPLDLYNILHNKELELQVLELQIRLALKIPNEFNRVGDTFKPGENEKKKDEKTPSKPNP